MADKHVAFHKNLAHLFSNGVEIFNRIGLDYTSPINHYDYIHKPNIIEIFLDAAVKGSLEFLIVDFTENLFVEVREPLIFSLLQGFEKLHKSHKCSVFYILVPRIPGNSCLSITQLNNLSQQYSESGFSVVLIANDGRIADFPVGTLSIENFQEIYKEELEKLYGSPETRLERKCVKRLGHFFPSRVTTPYLNCRHFSYFFHDCTEELYKLLRVWWNSKEPNSKHIIYDLKNNRYFKDAVISFSDSLEIMAESIDQILEHDHLISEYATDENCILVLDVVESGHALRKHIRSLGEKGVRIHNDILVAINKCGVKDTKLDNYNVHGFIKRPPEETDNCLQCAIGLSHTTESRDACDQIRTFDMLYMSNEVGWEPEPIDEVPKNRGQIPALPNFLKMIEEYGDWLSYKMHLLISRFTANENWFIIHPDEAQSNAIGNRLQVPLDERRIVIKVPRDLIDNADGSTEYWKNVIEENRSFPWVAQLNSVREATALILDIFNVSGRTAQMLSTLIDYYDISVFGYLCLVDFNKNCTIYGENGQVNKYSLYSWNNSVG